MSHIRGQGIVLACAILMGWTMDAGAAEIDVSVVVPLPDHRGYAPACVGAWTQGQDYPRHRYEVLVPTDGAEPARPAREQQRATQTELLEGLP